jgi:uncharacterized phage infection (PIP) family protein YhgE
MGIAALLAACPLVLQAQEKTKDGTVLSWTHSIKVDRDSVVNGTHLLPAYTITVFESDGSWVMDQWKNEMKAVSSGITGSRPVKVSDARVPAMGDAPLLLLANSTTDKKSKSGRLTVAFALNDSTPAEGDAQRVMHDLAVKLNKQVVQQQIDEQQKKLDKAADKHSSAQSSTEKAAKNISKANSDLQKSRKKLSKLQADKAKLQGDVHGMEKKFALTNDPKDLQKLTKARGRLNKNESAIAKEMQRENKIQSTLNKHQDSQARASGTLQDHTETKEDIMRIISELKRKQDAIR